MQIPTEYAKLMGEFQTSIERFMDDIKDIKVILKDILDKLDEHSKLITQLEYKQEEYEKMRRLTEEEKKKRKEREKEQQKRKQGFWDNIMNRILGAILVALILSSASYFWGMYHEYLKYQEPPNHTQKIGIKKV